MLSAIPKQDAAYLDRLRAYYARHGAMPSYAGLSEVMGFAKTSAVKLADRLTQAGYLQAAPGGKFAPTPQFFGLPMLEAGVRAGIPEGIDGVDDPPRVTLDSLLVDSPADTVLVRVKGDSMKDAGILDGDVAVVERRLDAVEGDIVVAIVDGEYTLKELFFKDGQPRLLPRNREFKPIVPSGRLEIYGVLRGLVRSYQSSKSAPKRHKTGGRR